MRSTALESLNAALGQSNKLTASVNIDVIYVPGESMSANFNQVNSRNKAV